MNQLKWPKWWTSLTPFQKYFPGTAVIAYGLILVALGGFRSDHGAICGLLLFFSYVGAPGRKFLQFALPFFLTGIIYDSQRFYSDLIRGPIHVEEPYLFDKTFFGISTPSGIMTPNEWWQFHTHPALDLITGFAYLVFILAFILVSAYFIYDLRKRAKSPSERSWLTERALQVPWGFFWLNMVGYTTYYWFAAAPPWYVARYGLGPARLDVPASSAGCVRFDQLLGTHFFNEMYGRSADVFGAIPSLHVSYPLMAIFFAFRFKSARGFCVLFYALMCFSAVYLNHHYVLDILWGSIYALVIAWVVDALYLAKTSQQTNRFARGTV